MSVPQEATAWRPDPGDELVGEVVDISERTGDYGRYPILELRTGHDQLAAVHCFHEVLQNELAGLAPQPGDRLRIVYRGRHERGYHSYRVRRADGTGGSIDWGRYGDSDDPTHAPAEPRATDEDEGDATDIPF